MITHTTGTREEWLSPSAVTLLAVILLKREAGNNVDSCIQRDVRNCPRSARPGTGLARRRAG